MLGNKIIKKYLREGLVTNAYARPDAERKLVLSVMEKLKNEYYDKKVFDIQRLIIDTRYGEYCNSIVEAQGNAIVIVVTEYKITIWYDLSTMNLFVNVKTFQESYTQTLACIRLILDIDDEYLEKTKNKTKMDLAPLKNSIKLQDLFEEYGIKDI